MDDILNNFDEVENGNTIHKRFHSLLREENLSELKANHLFNTESVNILGLSISRFPDSRYVSQPGYTIAEIANFQVQTSQSLLNLVIFVKENWAK